MLKQKISSNPLKVVGKQCSKTAAPAIFLLPRENDVLITEQGKTQLIICKNERLFLSAIFLKLFSANFILISLNQLYQILGFKKKYCVKETQVKILKYSDNVIR